MRLGIVITTKRFGENGKLAKVEKLDSSRWKRRISEPESQ